MYYRLAPEQWGLGYAGEVATGSLQQGRGSGPTRARAYDTKQRWLAGHRASSGSLAAPEARALDLERWTMDPRGHPDRPLAHPKRVTQRRLACHYGSTYGGMPGAGSGSVALELFAGDAAGDVLDFAWGKDGGALLNGLAQQSPDQRGDWDVLVAGALP